MVVNFFWVGLGGALGSMARYWMGIAVARQLGEAFPWGTLFINIIGSFIIAFFGALTFPQGPHPVPAEARLFVMVGVCGGFTTFSSFSLQTVDLLRGGEPLPALAYVVASVLLCISAAVVGYFAAGALTGRSPI
jgi:CrcB protein